MPKAYSIKWLVDDTSSVSAAKRNIKYAGDSEAAWLRALKAQESVSAAAGKMAATHQNTATVAAQKGAATRKKVASEEQQHFDVGLHKLQVTGLKFQDTLSKAADKNTKYRQSIFAKADTDEHNREVKTAKQAESTAKKKADADEKAAAKEVKARDDLQDRYYMRDQKRVVANQKRIESAALGPYGRQARYREKELSDEQAHAMKLNKIARLKSNEKIKQLMVEAGYAKDNFAASIADAFGLGGAATLAGAAVMGIGAGVVVVKTLAGAFMEAKKNAEAMAKESLDFMVQLRPLASVMGLSPTHGFATQVAQQGAQMGMSKDQSAKFQETFEGAAQSEKGKLAPAEYNKFKIGAGKLATVRGINPELAGNLLASVLKVKDYKAAHQGAKEAIADAATMFKIMDFGKGKMEVLAPQAQQLLATLASENELEGQFKTAGEIGLFTSLMAEAGPEHAGATGQAVVRALGKFGDKKKDPFYKRAGIKPGMNALDKLRATFSVFEEEEAKGISLEETMHTFGLDKEARGKRGLEAAFKSRKTVLPEEMKILEAGQAPGAADLVAKSIEEAFANRQDIKFTVGAANIEVARLKAESIPTLFAKQEAEKKLTDEDFETGFWGVLKKNTIGRDTVIEMRALEDARLEAGVANRAQGGAAIAGGAAAIGWTGGTAPPALIDAVAKVFEGLFGRNSAIFEKLDATAKNTSGPKTPPALQVGPPAGVAL